MVLGKNLGGLGAVVARSLCIFACERSWVQSPQSPVHYAINDLSFAICFGVFGPCSVLVHTDDPRAPALRRGARWPSSTHRRHFEPMSKLIRSVFDLWQMILSHHRYRTPPTFSPPSRVFRTTHDDDIYMRNKLHVLASIPAYQRLATTQVGIVVERFWNDIKFWAT